MKLIAHGLYGSKQNKTKQCIFKKTNKIHIDRLISFINDVLVKEYKYKKQYYINVSNITSTKKYSQIQPI